MSYERPAKVEPCGLRSASCLATVGLAAAVQDGDYRAPSRRDRRGAGLGADRRERLAGGGRPVLAARGRKRRRQRCVQSDPSATRSPRPAGHLPADQRSRALRRCPGRRRDRPGQPASTFEFDPEKGEKSSIAADDFIMFIIKRGDRLGVRLLDPENHQPHQLQGAALFSAADRVPRAGEVVLYHRRRWCRFPMSSA